MNFKVASFAKIKIEMKITFATDYLIEMDFEQIFI